MPRAVDGDNSPEAMRVFSSDACGSLRSFTDRGRACRNHSPLGNCLASWRGKLKVPRGSGMRCASTSRRKFDIVVGGWEIRFKDLAPPAFWRLAFLYRLLFAGYNKPVLITTYILLLGGLR